MKKLISALKFEEANLKVCLNDNLVKHRFYYVEEWVDSDKNSTEFVNDSILNPGHRVLKACYFGKFVSVF